MLSRYALVLFSLLAFSVGANASHADVIGLVIDPLQSNVEMSISGDSDMSAISGSAEIALDPPAEPFVLARLTALNAIMDDGISLSFVGGLVTATVAPGEGAMILVTAGPAGVVDGSNQFDQLNNEIGFTGSLEIVDPFNLAGGSRTIDMSTLDNTFADLLAIQLTVVGGDLTVNAAFDIEIILDNGLILTAVGSIVSTGILPLPPVVVAPHELTVIRGILGRGSVASLADSDNVDLSIRRHPSGVKAITEIDIKGSSSVAEPSSLEFTLEASVFARTTVTQRIFLFNYDTHQYESMDLRAARRFNDLTVIVEATGDLSRFVQSGTGCVEGKIRFRSANARQQFTANIDQAIWIIGQ